MMCSQSASRRGPNHKHRRSVQKTRQANISSPTVPKSSRPVSPLSVVVCTYERYGQLPYTIDALLRQDLECEIIVVDNSRDQTKAAQFKARYDANAGVRYILQPRPGLSRARNVGTSCATSARVAFIDDDAVAAPDWAANIVAAFDSFGPLARVVGGRVMPQWSNGRPAWLDNSLFGYLSLLDWGERTRELMAHEWLAGCNIAFDKATLQALGGFSEFLGRIGDRTLLSNEEIDVLAKFRRIRAKIIYAPRAMVEHVIDPSRLTPSWFRRRAAWQAVSDYLYDPKAMADYARTAGERLKLVKNLPFDNRLNLFDRADDSSNHAPEVKLIYDLVVAALSGELMSFDTDAAEALALHAFETSGSPSAHRRKLSGSSER